MATLTSEQAGTVTGTTEASKEAVAAAFGLSAAVTAVLNVVLAFIKDSYPPLNSFMAHLTGHHWRTHGLADVILFFVLGWIFTSSHIPVGGLTKGLAVGLTCAVVLSCAALGLWFIFV